MNLLLESALQFVSIQVLLGIVAGVIAGIIGGGLPVGAYGGRRDLMDRLAPLGPVYQAGTLSGNPAAMAAGTAVLKKLAQPGFYDRLEEKVAEFYRALSPSLDPELHTLQTCGSLFTLFFTKGPVTNFASAKTSDTTEYARVFRALLNAGILTAPSQFEANFIGAAHSRGRLKAVAEVFARNLLDAHRERSPSTANS